MSWTDRTRIETFHKLRDDFKIEKFVETGTFKGVGAEMFSHYFKEVFTVDNNAEYLSVAAKRLSSLQNVYIYHMNSWEFLEEFVKQYENGTIFFYLDAHFFDPKLPKEDRWVAVKELQALRNFWNCVIVVDDFDNGMGHLKYDDESFGWNVIGKHIMDVNPAFYFYTNTKESCRVFDEQTIYETPLTVDEHVLDNVRYMHSSDEKRYRGMLCATPRKLDLTKYKLVEFNGT